MVLPYDLVVCLTTWNRFGTLRGVSRSDHLVANSYIIVFRIMFMWDYPIFLFIIHYSIHLFCSSFQISWHDLAFFDPILYESLRHLIEDAKRPDATEIFSSLDLTYCVQLRAEEGTHKETIYYYVAIKTNNASKFDKIKAHRWTVSSEFLHVVAFWIVQLSFLVAIWYTYMIIHDCWVSMLCPW